MNLSRYDRREPPYRKRMLSGEVASGTRALFMYNKAA